MLRFFVHQNWPFFRITRFNHNKYGGRNDKSIKVLLIIHFYCWHCLRKHTINTNNRQVSIIFSKINSLNINNYIFISILKNMITNIQFINLIVKILLIDSSWRHHYTSPTTRSGVAFVQPLQYSLCYAMKNVQLLVDPTWRLFSIQSDDILNHIQYI